MRLQDKIRKEGTVLRKERVIMSGDTEPTHHRRASVRRCRPSSEFFKTIFLIDLLKGLWVTLKYTPQPAFTFQYPAERRPTAPRFRGVLRLQTEPGTGAQTCIVCDQCAKACPDDLIALGGHREPGAEDQGARLLRLQPVALQLLRPVLGGLSRPSRSRRSS